MPPAPSPTPLAANLMCMASMFIWAAGLPAAEPLIALLPPLPLAAGRMVLAALSLLPVWWLADGTGALRRADWPRGIAIGAVAFGAGAFLLVLGQANSDPVTAAIVSATMPVIGIALEVVLDRRRLTFALAGGVALSLVGGLVALNRTGDAPGLGLGALYCLISVVLFTLGSRLAVTALAGLSPIGRTAITQIGAAIGALLAVAAHALAGGDSGDWTRLGLPDWGALMIFSIGGLGIAQVLWIKSVGNLGIGLASLHINAAPFYVMLMLFALGQPWNWTQAAGAVIVGLGVLVAQNLLALPLHRPRRT
ncbi:MAG: DMT family transporter [Proteobacteria bacterium]|nr:DMT family transporter [Pseudomonadota bacterium]